MAAVAVAASLSTCHFPLLLAINKARQGHKNSNSSSHNNNSNCIKWRKSRQMKLAAASSSFLALFKLLLQIKRAAKEANKNRRIFRFHQASVTLFSPSFLLIPDSLSPSLLHTGKQKCFQITFHIILFAFYCRKSRISSCFSGSSCWQVKPAKKKAKAVCLQRLLHASTRMSIVCICSKTQVTMLGVVMVKLQYESVRGLIKKFML